MRTFVFLYVLSFSFSAQAGSRQFSVYDVCSDSNDKGSGFPSKATDLWRIILVDWSISKEQNESGGYEQNVRPFRINLMSFQEGLVGSPIVNFHGIGSGRDKYWRFSLPTDWKQMLGFEEMVLCGQRLENRFVIGLIAENGWCRLNSYGTVKSGEKRLDTYSPDSRNPTAISCSF
ncbi:MAG: hypothetical protein ABIH21_05180 [Patescibacteria group bacterium]